MFQSIPGLALTCLRPWGKVWPSAMEDCMITPFIRANSHAHDALSLALHDLPMLVR
ncbi:hypothetical protein PSEUDO8Z_60696 [Pseudomonas sp. 8Z]|nr:hypothetical protein PSEUDO8Z_60696 [Pseudomonas sp. 8Z]